MTFTKEELQFIYEIMDQIGVRGEASKAMVLQIMVKVRPVLQEAPDNDTVKERLEQVSD